MDTLIDKRKFPKEMHQKPNFKNDKKPTVTLQIILIIIALVLIVFFVYKIISKEKQASEKEFYTPEEQVEIVNNFNKTQVLSEKDRQEKINTFFNKE